MKERIPSIKCMLVLSLAILCGCSIKEDRSACPCRVTVDISEVDDDRFNFITVTAESVDGLLFSDYICAKPFPDQLTFKVPPGNVNINVISEENNRFPTGLMPYPAGNTANLCGYSKLSDMDSKTSLMTNHCPCEGGMFYLVPQGEECPPVYIDREEVNAFSDQVTVKTGLLKNYCKINVRINSTTSHLYKLRFTGNYCGYDGYGRPLEGEFYFDTDTESLHTACVNVPRQNDNSLNMTVIEEDDTVTDFPIGKYIEDARYDWSAESLEDIELIIDYVTTEIIFKVRDWEKVYNFDIVL